MLLLLLLSVSGGCRNKPVTDVTGEEIGAKKVRVQEVGKKSLGKPIILPADTIAALQAEALAEISATVAENKVSVGRKVAKGDLLVILEQRDLVLSVEKAKINRNKAELQRKKALADQELTLAGLNNQLKNLELQKDANEKDYLRLETLYTNGVISMADFEKAADNRKKIEWELELLQKQLAEAKRPEQIELLEVQFQEAELAYREGMLQLDKLKLTAPISGTVVEVNSSAGQRVTPGQGLVRIEQQQPIHIKALLTERDLTTVGERDEFAVYFPALDETVQGKVNYIAPSQKQGGSGFELEMAVDNSGEKIHPGMSAQVILDDQLAGEVVAVPCGTVMENNGNPYVYVVADEVACKRTVILGRRAEHDIEIINGLEQGELIVTAGQSLLTEDGTPVEIIN